MVREHPIKIKLISFISHLGDLTKPLVLTSVAAHTDKIIQARW
jgi:hypothetical protein